MAEKVSDRLLRGLVDFFYCVNYFTIHRAKKLENFSKCEWINIEGE